MRVAVIGADGQLGCDLAKIIPSQDLIPLTHRDIEIADAGLTRQVLTRYSPDVVINTAAYHRVDECEDNDLTSFQVNAFGAKHAALACRGCGAALVHISTDYVFDGEKAEPYTEGDTPSPRTVYGISKLAGEHYVGYLCPRHFVVRSSALFGVAGCKARGGLNFVEMMLKLAAEGKPLRVVDDQVVSPTYTLDLAAKIVELIHTQEYGLYHISNGGQCTWYQFTKKILQLAGVRAEVEPIATTESGARARRPRFSVLRNHRLEQMGRDDLRPWEQALAAYLEERGHSR